MLIAAAGVAGVTWYVPRVVSNDNQLFTGTVTSSGVIGLNFDKSGYIASVRVQAGDTVRKGQVLATEYAPDADALVTADKAAITSDEAKLAQDKAALVVNQQTLIAADNAQLAKDQAALATDRMEVAVTEIIAPSAGTVISVNGQDGETVGSSGVRNYLSGSQSAQVSQKPAFSLLPEGPQSSRLSTGSASALPVIGLRTSATWQVVALIPEGSVSRVKTGQEVTISVPAAKVTRMRGHIEEILPTPVAASDGTAYEAVVTVTGHVTDPPLSGMAVNVWLGS